MAQAIAKKKIQRRQPTKRKLPSSSIKKKQSAKLKKVTLPLTRTKTLQLTFRISTTKKRKSITRRRPGKIVSLTLIATGFVGLFYTGWLMFYQPPLHASPQISVPKVVAQPTAIKKSMSASDAMQLKIPNIGVDTFVKVVGKRPDGTMVVPSDPASVGQYKYAPTPGENGPAVIVGHVDSAAGPAVFWRLRELSHGQTIEISRADGTTVTFRVDSVKNFPQDSFPTEEVYGDIDYPGLRLITCGGTFNYLTRHYSDNTVVFATLVI